MLLVVSGQERSRDSGALWLESIVCLHKICTMVYGRSGRLVVAHDARILGIARYCRDSLKPDTFCSAHVCVLLNGTQPRNPALR